MAPDSRFQRISESGQRSLPGRATRSLVSIRLEPINLEIDSVICRAQGRAPARQQNEVFPERHGDFGVFASD